MNPIFRLARPLLLVLGLPFAACFVGACSSAHDTDLLTRRELRHEKIPAAAPTDQKMMDHTDDGTVQLVDDFSTKGRKSGATHSRELVRIKQQANGFNERNLLD